MTIEEKMEHFRSISLESANSQSAQSLRNYKQSLNDELKVYKENAKRLAEESEKAHLNQVRINAKKELSSAQMAIKKDLTACQAIIKTKVFNLVMDKISAYRKTPEYTNYLAEQIVKISEEYIGFNITIYIGSEDSSLLDELKSRTGVDIVVYDKDFFGGTRTIVPEKNILVDHSFKTRFNDEQEKFLITL